MGTIVEEALEGDVPDDPLALAIPELAHRPGDAPDFSDLDFSDAGETRRPDVTEAPEAMCDLATGLIRVDGGCCREIRS